MNTNKQGMVQKSVDTFVPIKTGEYQRKSKVSEPCPKRWIIWSVVIATLLLALGCTVNGVNLDAVQVGELINETETVDLEDAEKVRVTIKMGAGELKIGDGVEDLLEADFTYNVADWKPEVDYQVRNGEGRLTVRQPQSDQLSMSGNVRYEWDLNFNDDVPLDMSIECGAGDADIDMSKLDVTDVDIKLGAGDTEVDLSKNSSLEDLNVTMGAGNLTLDLNGQWEEDVNIGIQGGVGEINLHLPEDIGVRVKVTKGIGDVDSSGLYKRDGAYVNKAYDDADVQLEITIQAGIGQVNLDVVE